jgi:hypothetical protein
MPYFLDFGIDVIAGFQRFSPSMDLFFKALTMLGDETFFLISLPGDGAIKFYHSSWVSWSLRFCTWG